MELSRYLQESGVHLMPFGQQREDKLLDALRDMFAEQNRALSAQGQQLNAQGQLLAQQMQRLDSVANQISTIAQQQDAIRADFNTRWQDLPKLYVPRQEHAAMALDARTVALEEFRIAATKDIGDLKLSLQQQIHAAVEAASKEIVAAQIAAKDEINANRKTLDARQITVLVSVLTVGLSITVEFLLKVFFH